MAIRARAGRARLVSDDSQIVTDLLALEDKLVKRGNFRLRDDGQGMLKFGGQAAAEAGLQGFLIIITIGGYALELGEEDGELAVTLVDRFRLVLGRGLLIRVAKGVLKTWKISATEDSEEEPEAHAK
ncbi:hypothetical protein KEM52_001334 [Ascosphaera acerosa]|nr:hypothetical protein KEM52_001334 [Ascosphaera acerosa]